MTVLNPDVEYSNKNFPIIKELAHHIKTCSQNNYGKIHKIPNSGFLRAI